MIDKVKFDEAINRALAYGNEGKIGTLGEKKLHRVLKYYFEPDESKHESSFLGVVADIRNEQGIIEIQTRAFDKLLPKLDKFLSSEKVTVIYPVVERKTICRINTETGETVSVRKSPKMGKATDALPELAKIRSYLLHPNLSVLLVFLDATETRMENGKIKIGRKTTTKIDCIPTAINSILPLCGAEDYSAVLPRGLPREFTSAQFERITGLHAIDKHNSLILLLELGILVREKNNGRAFVYSIQEGF